MTVAFVAGQVLRHRESRHHELALHASRIEAGREAQIALAIADERARIARELHDVVAHCVNVMVVQAGAGEDLLDRDPELAREPLRAVQDTGRQAVTEMRRMLGLLRDGDPARANGVHPDREPQPGTSQLPELAERMRALGLSVRLQVSGPPRPIPPGVDLTAYRVVQEALTNTLKHGGSGTEVVVDVRYEQQSLCFEVTDDGRTQAAAATGRGTGLGTGTGHGLIGMTERVAIFGGTIDVGPRPEGGFRVRVALPLDAS